MLSCPGRKYIAVIIALIFCLATHVLSEDGDSKRIKTFVLPDDNQETLEVQLIIVTWRNKMFGDVRKCDIISDENRVDEILKRNPGSKILTMDREGFVDLLEDCKEVASRTKRQSNNREYSRDDWRPNYSSSYGGNRRQSESEFSSDGRRPNNREHSRDDRLPNDSSSYGGNRQQSGSEISSNGRRSNNRESSLDSNRRNSKEFSPDSRRQNGRESSVNSNRQNSKETRAETTTVSKTVEEETTEGYDGWNVIFPGTKWCGAGDVAKNHDDLGSNADTDKCCRAHDLCNDTMAPGQTKNNLTNDSKFTKLSCQCDDDFYDCLDRVNSMVSNKIGNIYFNILRRDCYKSDYPVTKSCKQYRSFLKITCKEFEQNINAEKVHQWIKPKTYKKLPIPGPLTITLPF